MIIAVDGLAASGKGTIASALARHFGLPHLDTGTLYRAVAANLLRLGGNPSIEADAVLASEISGIDLADPSLKSEGIGGVAALISGYPRIRSVLFDRQRAFADQPGGAVLDGRDIGTVIAPHAHAKLFVTASPEVRARRRHAELLHTGDTRDFVTVLADIAARDARDSNRSAAPLHRADDAALLDTTELGIDAAVQRAIALVSAATARTGKLTS